jgi:hypothetical protein
MNRLLKINLQLFTEGTPAAPSPAPAVEPAPATAEPTPAPAAAPQLSTDQRLKDLWDKSNVPQQTPTEKVDNPATQAPEPPKAPDNPEPQAQPEKIMNKYDTVGDLVKAHQSLQTTWNRDHQALLDTQKVLDQLKAEKAELEAKLQTPNPQQPEQPIDELAGLDNEAILEKLMADPMGVIKKVAEQIADSKYKPLESKIAPVVEREEAAKNLEAWNEAVEEFHKETTDMADYVDGMKQYITENNLQNSAEPQKVLKDAYAHAKAHRYDTKVAEANAKIAELEAQLKTSKEDAIKEHLAGVRQTQNQLPNTIAGNSNSGAPATPPLNLKGKPMSEVHKAASAFLFGNR